MKTFIVVTDQNEWIYFGRHEDADEVDQELHEIGMKPNVEYYVYELADYFPASTIKILPAQK